LLYESTPIKVSALSDMTVSKGDAETSRLS